MNTVFISYSNKDRGFVERLAHDLDSHGLHVFYDQRIAPGESWPESLSKAIESADYVLIVLSPNSVESAWVAQETNIGLAREVDGKAQVIPLLIEDCQVPTALAGKTYASFNRDYNAGLQRVLAVLQNRSTEIFAEGVKTTQEGDRIKSEVAQFKATSPIASTGRTTAQSSKLQCFIVMPFGDESLQIVYEDFIKPVLEQDCSLQVERGDDVFGSDVVMDDIRSSIEAADLVIADLTGKNANVFYEVGICHALEKPVLLLAQSMEDVPFDLRHRRVLLYNYTLRGCKRLEGHLRDQVAAILAKLEKSAA